MPISDYYVVLNPAADRGRAAALEPHLARSFAAAGVRHELTRTEGPGHAAELAEAAARAGWQAVVAVGGDGLVHEVANGLLRASGEAPTLPMGLVGAGSGNDFAKMLRLPHHDPVLSIQRLLHAEARAVDVGRVSGFVGEGGPAGAWYFINGIGLGFDAQVAGEARRIRWLRGGAIYAWALLRTLRRLQNPRVRVRVDGVEVADRRLVITTIGNGACHGGSFWLCPDARIDDGLLDVLLADRRGPAEVLGLVPRVLRGSHLGLEGVALHRGRTVRIESDEDLPIHADGEIVARSVRALDVEILPGRLRVLV